MIDYTRYANANRSFVKSAIENQIARADVEGHRIIQYSVFPPNLAFKMILVRDVLEKLGCHVRVAEDGTALTATISW